jgi:hypothetical protein
MTAEEMLEQRLTGRADSFVPARALMMMAGRRPDEADTPPVWNNAMHWGTGVLLGALRGVWSAVGIRGAEATCAHVVVRLAFDQTVENVAGVGAPPSTWRSGERVVDVAGKGTYSLVTGLVADGWIRPDARVLHGTHSH